MTKSIIKGKERLLIVIILIIALNFILLSIGYGQTNVNIRAYVPETEENKRFSNNQIKQEKPTTKENKYQYFFEKFWLTQTDKETNAIEQEEVQTIHDKIVSHFFMWLILFVIAIISFFVLRIIDHYIISIFRS